MRRGRMLCGFRVKGHSGAGSEGNDIVCAAVSSAAYLAANTITDVIGAKAEIELDEGYLSLIVAPEQQARCADILRGLSLHLSALAEQYPENIQFGNTEV